MGCNYIDLVVTPQNKSSPPNLEHCNSPDNQVFVPSIHCIHQTMCSGNGTNYPRNTRQIVQSTCE